MIKNILIDVDGTLMDSKDAFYKSLNETLCAYGIEETHDSSLFGMSAQQALQMLRVKPVQEIKNHWERLFAFECARTAFYSGIEEMMKTLSKKGIRFYIITSRSRCTVAPLCCDSLLSAYIDGYIAAEDTEFQKPSPEPILKALTMLNANKDETIYIGDTFHDYCAAAAAGILFGQAGWNKSANNTSYNMLFNHPAEIITFIGETEQCHQ